MDDMWVRFTTDMLARVSGPMKFRLVLQPAMAAFFAIRAGLADARAGRQPYLWGLLWDRGHREAMLKDGWKSVGRVFILAVVLDVVYQLYELHFVYPLQALAVALILAIVPYLIVRGLVTRLVQTNSVRLALGIVGAIVLLLAVAPFLIPVNQFRPAIERQASAALGRKVDLGRLRLSLLSGSLSADSLAVGDDPAFSTSPFLLAMSVACDVELLPLLMSRSLKVTGIRIDHPNVTLIRNSTGQWNYASLGSSSASAIPNAFSIRKLELRNGLLTVVRSPTERRGYDHVDVTLSDLSPMTTGAVEATASRRGGGTLSLAGRLGPVDGSDLSRTPLDVTFTIHGLNLATAGFFDQPSRHGGVLDVKGTIASTRDEAVVAGSATLSKALLVAGGSPTSQPVDVVFNTKYDFRTQAGQVIPSEVRIGGAAARLSGTYDASGEDTVVNFRITGARMPARDLEPFLPALGIRLPDGAHLAAGAIVSDLKIVGPTKRLVGTGHVGVFNAKLSGFDLGYEMRAIPAFAGLDTGKDLVIEEITTNLRVASDGLSFDRFNSVVPALGNLTGAGTIDAGNNLHFGMVATLTRPLGRGGVPLGTAGTLNDRRGRPTGGAVSRSSKDIPFLVQGPTSNPQFVPDFGGLVAHTLEGQAGANR